MKVEETRIYSGLEETSGMLLTEENLFCRTSTTWNLAFMAGSSKHGNARLASVGSNLVTANHLRINVVIKYQNLSFYTALHFILLLYAVGCLILCNFTRHVFN